jgi:hypothetical protein
VLERYNTPTIVVNYAQGQAWRRQRKARLDCIRPEMDAGHYLM